MSETRGFRKAISKEEFQSRAHFLGLSEREIRYIINNTDFCNQTYINQQVCFLRDYLKKELNKTFFSSTYANVFNLNPRTVRRYLLNGPVEPKPLGRHMALDDSIENSIVIDIINREQTNPFTRKELLEHIFNNYEIVLTKGWLNLFLQRQKNKIKACRSFPIEESRFIIPREFLIQHIENLLKVVENRYSELVFNLDEIGYSEWESRKIKRVIVSTKTEESGVFHSIDRSKAHISLLSCISASGDTLTPLLITKNSIPENFWYEGLRENEDIIIRERNPPYMDSEIFHDYISNCFIPYVNSIRKTLQVEDEYAVLLMDSCQSHTSTETIQELTQNKIIVLTFPAHTTNLFQPCDLSLFGSMKRALSNIKADSKNEKVKLYLTKIIRAYEQVTTSFNIRSTFIKAGISYERTGLRFKLKINPENIIQNHGFKEIWNQNISIDEISARRRNQKFGVINEDGLNNEEAIYINTINQEQLDQIFRTLE